MLKRILTSALGLLALCSAALAQPFPQPGVISGYVYKQTYRAVSIGLVLAATPTDFFCIAGSSSKTIRVNTIEITSSGVSTAINMPVVLLRRTTLDTGGTAATTTANPANTIGKLNTTFGNATATLIAYTANPTINDTSPTYLWSTQITVGTTALAGLRSYLNFNDDNGGLTSPPTILNGQTTQQLCLNGQSFAGTLTSNTTAVTIEWTEE